jgi:hypothetical protein
MCVLGAVLNNNSTLKRRRSAPSDTGDDDNDDGITAAGATATVTPATPASGRGGSVKDELMELIAGGLLNFASPQKRAAVNELLLKLEALNPTQQPAYSVLLNGQWEFLYTGGISPGILGACVVDLDLDLGLGLDLDLEPKTAPLHPINRLLAT